MGEHPNCVTVSPDDKYVYVTNTQGDSVSVIDAQRLEVIKTIAVGGFPEGISYDATSHKVYVANWFDNTVSVIDTSTNTLTSTISTGTQSRAFGQFIAEVGQ